MTEYISIDDLKINLINRYRKIVIACNSLNEFLRYFCFLMLKKEIQKSYHNVKSITYFYDEDIQTNFTKQQNSLFLHPAQIKLYAFFNLPNWQAQTLTNLTNHLTNKLKENTPGSVQLQHEEKEIFYIDNCASIKDIYEIMNNYQGCFIINLQKIQWNESKKIIQHIFSYFDIMPTNTMIEKSCVSFVPANFFDLFTLLSILKLNVDNHRVDMQEKMFLELIKNVIQRRNFKSILKKDIKSFFYWKTNITITNNEQWKGFLIYKMIDALRDDICKDLKIEQK
ncbi:MAG: hypothetical protein ACK4NF_07625, partial [Planctomycetota bacterium]